MSYTSASKVYKKNQVETASPKQLVVLLYEGAVKFIRLAELAIEKNDMTKANRNILKAQDIVTELMVSLNHQNGENAIASELQTLYSYILNQLIQANLKKDTEKLAETRNLLSELREAWASI
ncbi:flagellar export chaperone FliS [Alkalibacterium psychrotolerans]